MKKTTFRRAIVMILALCMLALPGFSGVASASTQPRYINISQITVDFSISNIGCTSNYASIMLKGTTLSANLVVELQRENDGDWESIKTWSSTGKASVVVNEQWYVSRGNSYRILVTANVYDASGNLIETTDIASQVEKY